MKSESTFDQKKYLQQYQKEKRVQFRVWLSKEYDADILNHLASVPNQAEYFKKLVRHDIASAYRHERYLKDKAKRAASKAAKEAARQAEEQESARYAEEQDPQDPDIATSSPAARQD